MRDPLYIKAALCTFLLLFFLNGCTSIKPSNVLSTREFKQDKPHFNYEHYETFLQDYVHNGLVDYQSAFNRPDDLETFYAQLASYSPDSHPDLFPTQNHRLAYWLNAYNSTVIQGVLTYYPIQSVEDVKEPVLLFFLPSKSGFFLLQRFTYGGTQTSLYSLENSVIRKRFNDPRIHFALNCASSSCPKLPSQPFYPEILDQQLDAEARKFINNPENVRFDSITNTLYLSAIFDWYRDDFLQGLPTVSENDSLSLKNYILLYAAPELSSQLKDIPTPTIVFVDYDWRLNDLSKRK